MRWRKRHPIQALPSYWWISTAIQNSLMANGSSALGQGRLRALRRALDVFGFHLAPLDLRQNADVQSASCMSFSSPPGVPELSGPG